MVSNDRASAIHRYRLAAVFCVLVLAVCAVVVQPHVETGLMDEWSYIRSAQVLAQTGHIVYNGWGAMPVGWQLFLGALVFKVFGFLFLAARISILVLAMATVFLIQRCMVRAGISEWNATLGTLMVVLTPIMLPIALSFMTDVPGMLVMIVCLYACLRALQASTDRAQMAWLCLAAISNGVGGSVRQVAWLGVLVMVPSTLWLLRRKRGVVLAGVLSCVAGICIMLLAMWWFAHQPYSVQTSNPRPKHTAVFWYAIPGNMLRPMLQAGLFLLPVEAMCLPAMWKSRQRVLFSLAVCGVLGALAFGVVHTGHAGRGLLAPFMGFHGDYVSPFGLYFRWPMHCHYPVVLHDSVRWVLTLATVVSVVAVLACMAGRGSLKTSEEEVLTGRQVCRLIVPTIAGYAMVLVPRGLAGLTLDRYLLPLLPLLLILLLRLFQSRVRTELPWMMAALLAIVGSYSVAATHDLFATYRAALTALNEIRAMGVPRSEIDGGWEYNGWTELEQGGYMHLLGAHLPTGVAFTVGKEGNACPIDDLFLTPEVTPRYSLSFDSTACEGEVGFKPVVYRRWLGPRTATVYVVSNPRVAGAIHHNTGGRGGAGDLCWGRDATTAGAGR